MRAAGLDCTAVTVDHRLRGGSAEEVARVAQVCAAMGVPHRGVARPKGADWGGQSLAREGRYAALARIAAELDAPVVTGHTLDDQVETVRMRARRAGGTLGLAGIAPVATLEGTTRLLRPLLGAPRDGLRRHLKAHGIGWIDDPSNADPRFERVRTRRTGDAADAHRIARFAAACRRERALLMRTIAADLDAGLGGAEGRLLYRPGLRGIALVHALRWLAAWVGRAAHLPAQDRVAAFVDREPALTIAGSVLRKDGGGYAVEREERRAAAIRDDPQRGEAEPFARFRPASDDPVFAALARLAPVPSRARRS